jgi:uncharacterized protein
MILRNVERTDLHSVLSINQAAVPGMNSLELADIERFAADAAWFRVVEIEAGIAAFLIVLDADTDYESVNYRWFRERYTDFLYIDRIAVDSNFHRRGLGRALYEDLFAEVRRRGIGRICAEVNLRPPNPGSIAFHRALGFVQTGELEHHGGEKKLAMFVREDPTAKRTYRADEAERTAR